jgi:uncharacterized protein YdiU (UPF0061 family)
MDYFDKHCICNDTDTQGRYSYNNQPYIARWNLSVLADTLKHIVDAKKLMQYLDTFFPQHEKVYLELMNKRLGLDSSLSGNLNLDLIVELLTALETAKCDYNCFFNELTNLKNLENISSITDMCVYRDSIVTWFENYKKVVEQNKTTYENRKNIMKKVNPKYIIKNYMLQESIDLANQGDFTLVNDLLKLAQNPFDAHEKFERYSKPTPTEHANLRLSCSS